MAITDPSSHAADVDRLEAALLEPDLSPIVDVVLSAGSGDPDVYEAASAEGRVRIRRRRDGHGWAFETEVLDGVDPLADQSVDRFTPLADERDHRYPDRSANAYPFAYEQVAQLFDSRSAPDLVAVHSAAHNWEDHGGHRGEHGSIGVVQARAPFIVAGAGVAARGTIAEACKLVDVAPTVMALLGAAPGGGVGLAGADRADALLSRQDGEVLTGLIDESASRPDHVVGVLMDGTNANVLYDMAARGEAPNVARLMAMGTTYGFGVMSSLPTITLANHTTILTGAYPGHHGILHNAWWDRARGEQVVTNSPATWLTAMGTLDPGVETLYQAVARAFPGSVSVAINEPCDTGADHSIFDLMRRGEAIDRPPPVEELPHTTQMFVRPVKEYRWSTLVDHAAVEQFVGIWGGEHRGRTWPLPRFTWVNFALTDAAMHEGGPHSDIAAAAVRDTDARLGELLDAVDAAGVFDRTAFFVVADHGMEESNPSVTGSWGPVLAATGVAHRDEAYGFIYANP
jgi:hypothetical protein